MKKIVIYLLSMSIVFVLAIGVTLAYLTDEESYTNVMTVGNINIQQLEYERDENGKLIPFKQNKPLYPAVYDSNEFGAGMYNDWIQKWDSIGSQGGIELFHDSVQNVLDKFVFVKNTGLSKAYVRTVFAFEQGDFTSKELFDSIIKLRINTLNWDWKYIDTVSMDGTNFYIVTATYKGSNNTHFNGELSSGSITYPSLLQVMMYNSVKNEDIEQFGDNYKIYVVSQAVQTSGFDEMTTFNTKTNSLAAQNALNIAFGEISKENHPWISSNTPNE